MDYRRDYNSIQTIERGNKEHQMKLDRARNPPLNISTFLPPEILGAIFYWVMIFQQKVRTPLKVPHSLLLVDRNWFQVALQTPQLWTSWGSSLKDWERRCASPVVSKLNLELRGYCEGSPSKPLLSALQDRAARDLIQRVSVKMQKSDLLNSIIPAITARGEGIQSISLEFLELYIDVHCPSKVQLSDFFSRYRFPKLQSLVLSGCFEFLSWNLLASRTGALINLSLSVRNSWPIPTPSELLSILSSNPNLQRLKLHRTALPNFDHDDHSSFQVELPHLEWIHLTGNSRDALKLLSRLRPADKLDSLRLDLSYHSTSDISHTLARFLSDSLLRRGNIEEGVEVGGRCSVHGYSLWVGDVVKLVDCPPSTETKWFMSINVSMKQGEGPLEDGERGKLFFDSLAHIRNHVISLISPHSLLSSPNLLAIGMENLVEIWINRHVSLSEWFVEPDLGGARSYGQILPSLKHLSLFKPGLDEGNWTPLVTFLSSRASVGNLLELLEISPCPHICPDVVEEIKRVVQEFKYRSESDLPCPHGRCPSPG